MYLQTILLMSCKVEEDIALREATYKYITLTGARHSKAVNVFIRRLIPRSKKSVSLINSYINTRLWQPTSQQKNQKTIGSDSDKRK